LSIGKNKKKEVGGEREENPAHKKGNYAGTLLHLSIEDKLPAVGNHF
jgi:hypothetical protein